MIKLSFIIPAYNASSTIVRCLDSIYALSICKNNFEVIVVDDCSTDNTVVTIEDYAKSHGNLLLFRQKENHRQGAARNKGLKIANGRYIMYVDADDTVSPELTTALNFATESNVDMLFCTTAWEEENHQFIPRQYDIPPHEIMDGRTFANQYYDVVCVGPWTYLWKKSFLVETNIPFIEDRRMEDFDFVEKHIIKAKYIAFTSNTTYYYHINEGSTVRSINYQTVADWVHVCYRRWVFCEQIAKELPNFVKQIDFQCKCFVSSSLSFRRLSRFSATDVKRIIERIGDDALKYIYKKGAWSWFVKCCLKAPWLVYPLIAIANPLAQISRQIVRNIRTIKHK